MDGGTEGPRDRLTSRLSHSYITHANVLPRHPTTLSATCSCPFYWFLSKVTFWGCPNPWNTVRLFTCSSKTCYSCTLKSGIYLRGYSSSSTMWPTILSFMWAWPWKSYWEPEPCASIWLAISFHFTKNKAPPLDPGHRHVHSRSPLIQQSTLTAQTPYSLQSPSNKFHRKWFHRA